MTIPESIEKITRRYLDADDEYSPNKKFSAMGLDEEMVMRIVVDAEFEFTIDINYDEQDGDFNTPQDLINIIERKLKK